MTRKMSLRQLLLVLPLFLLALLMPEGSITTADSTTDTAVETPTTDLSSIGFTSSESAATFTETKALIDTSVYSTAEEELPTTPTATTVVEEEVNATESVSETVAAETTEGEEFGNLTTSVAPMLRTAAPQHPCVADVDESEPEFQRYVCTGNWIVSLIATTFLLSMMFFAVVKNIATWGFINLVDVRKAGVSFPQRPEFVVLICSTLPTIFTTIARPLFYPYPPQYTTFISEVSCMQARQFFDLFSRTAAVYHMIYWAYRMPIIRWLWRNYLRFNAFRAVWTKEHIIEVLRDKFAPEKDDKFRRMFQNSPECMYYYAQFLQSGLPMQYFQTLVKSGNRSPSMSTAAIDGLGGMQSGQHGRTGLSTSDGDVLPRVNLGHIMNVGSDESASPKISHYGNFLGPTGTSPGKLSLGHGVSRNPSFRGSSPGRSMMGPLMAFEGGFGQHLSPEDAANSIIQDRQGTASPDMHSLTMPPWFSSQEMLFPGHGQIPGFEMLSPNEKKKEEEENFVKPPTREFVYICKHALPGVIYVLAFFITLPSIFGFDMYQYESRITVAYFYYDFIFIVFIPMVAITAAFYHGVLAKTQLNGGPKMRFRLRCYYVNFVVLNMPVLCLMTTAMAYRITLSREVETEMYGNGIIIALTAYHAQFVLKTLVYTTGCNCICCSERCLNRYPRLRNCIITMVTPRNKSALPPQKKTSKEGEEGQEADVEENRGDHRIETAPMNEFGQGMEIQILPPDPEPDEEEQGTK